MRAEPLDDCTVRPIMVPDVITPPLMLVTLELTWPPVMKLAMSPVVAYPLMPVDVIVAPLIVPPVM